MSVAIVQSIADINQSFCLVRTIGTYWAKRQIREQERKALGTGRSNFQETCWWGFEREFVKNISGNVQRLYIREGPNDVGQVRQVHWWWIQESQGPYIWRKPPCLKSFEQLTPLDVTLREVDQKRTAEREPIRRSGGKDVRWFSPSTIWSNKRKGRKNWGKDWRKSWITRWTSWKRRERKGRTTCKGKRIKEEKFW